MAKVLACDTPTIEPAQRALRRYHAARRRQRLLALTTWAPDDANPARRARMIQGNRQYRLERRFDGYRVGNGEPIQARRALPAPEPHDPAVPRTRHLGRRYQTGCDLLYLDLYAIYQDAAEDITKGNSIERAAMSGRARWCLFMATDPYGREWF